MKRLIATLAIGLNVVACGDGNKPDATIAGVLPGHVIRPPQGGLAIGGLYYVPEGDFKPGRPLAIEDLCKPRLLSHGFAAPEAATVPDIDILSDNSLGGTLDGLQAKLLSVGLSGSISDYFSYKLTNVTKLDIPKVPLDQAFEKLSSWDECKDWQRSVSGSRIYQIKSAYQGDLVFTRKEGVTADPSLSVKLDRVQPKIEASLKHTLDNVLTGRGLFVVIVPVDRTPAAPRA
ncbi:MAG: hypothetical protein U1E62_23125 [Alsobacter sp.]